MPGSRRDFRTSLSGLFWISKMDDLRFFDEFEGLSERDREDLRQRREKLTRKPLDLSSVFSFPGNQDSPEPSREKSSPEVQETAGNAPERPQEDQTPSVIVPQETGPLRWIREVDGAFDQVVGGLQDLTLLTQTLEDEGWNLPDSLKTEGIKIQKLLIQALIPYADDLNQVIEKLFEYSQGDEGTDLINNSKEGQT